MTLDDVLGSDRDEFPLEQVQGLFPHPCLEEDWDDAVDLLPANKFCQLPFEDPHWERLPG